MDGENNGKPYKNWWFGGKTHYFRKHPYRLGFATPKSSCHPFCHPCWGGGVNGHDEEREVTCSLEVSVDLTRQIFTTQKTDSHPVAKHEKK